MTEWWISAIKPLNLDLKGQHPSLLQSPEEVARLQTAGAVAAHNTQAAYSLLCCSLPRTPLLNQLCWGRNNPGSFPKCHLSLRHSYLESDITSFDNKQAISSSHPSPPPMGSKDRLCHFWQCATRVPLPFEAAEDLSFQMWVYVLCSSQWQTLIQPKMGFHFRSCDFPVKRRYCHLLAFYSRLRSSIFFFCILWEVLHKYSYGIFIE